MTSDTDLPRQPDTIQQQLIEKRDNSSWKAFSILLIVINLLSVWPYPVPFLLPLVPINCIAAFSYWKKRSAPWIAFLLSLLADYIFLFYFAGLALSQYTGGVAAIMFLPLALGLTIIGCIAVFIYIRTQHPRGKVKVISYIALIYLIYSLLQSVIAIIYSLLLSVIDDLS
jgi:hypothetical protein